MSIYNTSDTPEFVREESLKLFISAVRAAPDSSPKNLPVEELVKYMIEGSQALADYVLTGKTD
ncbi:MAG: hypothetical protein LBD71_05510 [Treponema sp.]|jgi:hypothetical protein|nr:hypothetical protein [Treponema sp.]